MWLSTHRVRHIDGFQYFELFSLLMLNLSNLCPVGASSCWLLSHSSLILVVFGKFLTITNDKVCRLRWSMPCAWPDVGHFSRALGSHCRGVVLFDLFFITLYLLSLTARCGNAELDFEMLTRSHTACTSLRMTILRQAATRMTEHRAALCFFLGDIHHLTMVLSTVHLPCWM